MITPAIVKPGVLLGQRRKWMIGGLRASVHNAEYLRRLIETVDSENMT
jgi:hypothetical protein